MNEIMIQIMDILHEDYISLVPIERVILVWILFVCCRSFEIYVDIT